MIGCNGVADLNNEKTIFETESGAIINPVKKLIWYNNLPTITVYLEIRKLFENNDNFRCYDIYGIIKGNYIEIPHLLYKGKKTFAYDLELREDWTEVETKEEVE